MGGVIYNDSADSLAVDYELTRKGFRSFFYDGLYGRQPERNICG